jgi:hypothetical protein
MSTLTMPKEPTRARSKEPTRFCKHCNKAVTFHVEPVSQLKQLGLCVLTLGLWLPIWIGMIVSPTKLCDECNEPLWND